MTPLILLHEDDCVVGDKAETARCRLKLWSDLRLGCDRDVVWHELPRQRRTMPLVLNAMRAKELP